MLISNFVPFINLDQALIFHRMHTFMFSSNCLFNITVSTGRLSLIYMYVALPNIKGLIFYEVILLCNRERDVKDGEEEEK
jgi:uncharacterized membrane protein YGL010W